MLDDTLALFQRKYPTWGWILRDNRGASHPDRGAYFCHLMSPEWLHDYHSGEHAEAYGSTPVAAIIHAMEKLK